MAVSEACALWCEQRIEEELSEQATTGKSLRAIGRDIAKEIEKYFEAKVAPETLAKRAERMVAATNVAEDTSIENDTGKEGIQDNQVQKSYGGKRSGAGRKPKAISEKEEVIKELFDRSYSSFFKEVQRAKLSDWKVITRDDVLAALTSLISYVDI